MTMRFQYMLSTLLMLSSGFACSDDDADGDTTVGDGVAGGRSTARQAMAGSSGESGDVRTYSVAETCELFGAALCDRGAECGVVVDETDTELVCLDCESGFRDLIAASCEDVLTQEKSVTAVDRCIASISASPCDDVCSNADVANCEVLDELLGSEDDDEPLVCNAACSDN
jgi:hypothetical protein